VKQKVFRSGAIAAVLGLALGWTACTDDFDEMSSSDQPLATDFAGNPLKKSSPRSQYDGLLLTKIYFTGSDSTVFDQYFRITNNGDRTIDADGLIILESKFGNTSHYFGFSDSISVDTFVTQVVYQVPYHTPIAPDSSIIVVSRRQDFSPARGLDLTNADFGWVQGTTPPLLDEIFSYSATYWVLHNRGFHSYAIAALEKDSADFINENAYTGTYWIQVGDTAYQMTTSKAYSVPQDWIVDAVNVRSPVASEDYLHTLPYDLDEGYTYAGDTSDSSSKLRFRHAVTRVKSGTKFVDNDDSTRDFIPNDPVYDPWQ
jgi:hypothetical protein